jgi:hypothetical protein
MKNTDFPPLESLSTWNCVNIFPRLYAATLTWSRSMFKTSAVAVLILIFATRVNSTPSPLKCDPPLTKCGILCTSLSDDLLNCGKCNNPCDGVYAERCENSQCVCVPWATLCHGKCVDLSTDSENCDRCGAVCPFGQLCFGGVCS